MPALNKSTRFFQPEVSRVHFLPTIAATTLIPTRAEITAGTNVTAEIADLSGWQVRADMIATPDLASRFVSQIAGRTKAEQSSITYYADKTGDDIRTVNPRGQTGYIVFMDGGDVPTTGKMDVYPVEVAAVGKARSTGDQALQVTIDYAITGPPAEDVAIPA